MTRRLDHRHKPAAATGILASRGVESCRCDAYRVERGAWVPPYHRRRYWGRRMPS